MMAKLARSGSVERQFRAWLKARDLTDVNGATRLAPCLKQCHGNIRQNGFAGPSYLASILRIGGELRHGHNILNIAIILILTIYCTTQQYGVQLYNNNNEPTNML